MSSEERRASIIEAAITIISHTSFERCTTALIAREAGVSEPMIYRHFQSKKGLQLAVLDTISKDLSALIDNNTRNLKSINLPEILWFVDQLMNQIFENQNRLSVLLKGLALEDQGAREKMWEIFQSIHGVMKMVLKKLTVMENTGHDGRIKILSWILVSWVTVMPAVNQLGKRDELPENQFDSLASFIKDVLNKPAGNSFE